MEPKISITKLDYAALVRAEVVRPIRSELRAWLVPGIGGAVVVAGAQIAAGAPVNSVGGALLFAVLSILGGVLAIIVVNAVGAPYRVYNRLMGEWDTARGEVETERVRANTAETARSGLAGALLAEQNTHRGDWEQSQAQIRALREQAATKKILPN
jgi:hypothetical protein